LLFSFPPPLPPKLTPTPPAASPTGGHKAFGWLPLPALKGNHLYSPNWYALLLASNLVLRFSWAHRLLGDLEARSSVLMVVALLEVVRRWQWLYVRVETELRKLKALQLLPKDSEDGSIDAQEPLVIKA
jgi:hypothetical protein